MSATTINDQTEKVSPTPDEMTSQMRDSTGEVTAERAQRFYDRLRERIHSYAEAKGKAAEKTTDFVLLVPDMFMLLWRLTKDPRVSGKNKVLLGSGLAYYFFPLDIIPELFLGPVAFLDDLIFGVYVLNRMLLDTDAEILREHWSGPEDILTTIQRVLNAADTLVAGDLMASLKKLMRAR